MKSSNGPDSAVARCSAVLLGLMLAWTAPAASQWGAPKTARWSVFQSTDGLPNDTVTAILQTSTGSFWFGTPAGPVWSDGLRWERSQEGVWVEAIIEDGSGALWFATRTHGVLKLWESQWTAIVDSIPDSIVWTAFEDGTGALWFGTEQGVTRRDSGGRWRTFTIDDNLPDNNVFTVYEDEHSDLWFGTANGAARLVGEAFEFAGLQGDSVYSIIQDTGGDLWFGTSRGLRRWAGSQYTTVVPDTPFRSAGLDPQGRLWFGSEDAGVYRFDRHGQIHYMPGFSDLPSATVLSVFVDRGHNLWFGTNQGVARYGGEQWVRSFTADSGRDKVRTLMRDRARVFWFGTLHGVRRLEGEVWSVLDASNSGLSVDSVQALAQDSSGAYWFGTTSGVFRWDGDRQWTRFTKNDGLTDDNIASLAAQDSHVVWAGTIEGGACRYDGQDWTCYGGDVLPSTWVRAVAIDTTERIWFGTLVGVASLDRDGNWRTYQAEEEGLLHNSVWAVMVDDRGDVWFGTDAGVSRYDPNTDTWDNFPQVAANESWRSEVNGLSQTPDGRIWAATYAPSRLARFEGEGWHQVGIETNSAKGILADEDGHIWIAHDGSGVGRFEPDRGAPQAVISVGPQSPTGDRTPRFVFDGGFADVREIEFSFWMDNADPSDWLTTNVHFSDALMDGIHTFHLRSRDGLGNSDPLPATWRFDVDGTPPQPIIASPAFGSILRDTVRIHGTADDARFVSYRLEVRPTGLPAGAPASRLLASGSSPVRNATLAHWDTHTGSFEDGVDGVYDLQLFVIDNLGLIGTALVSVIVDNEFPSAEQTSPVRVNAAAGGEVFTTRGEVRLYFPPRGFARDAVVTVSPCDSTVLAAGPVVGTPPPLVAFSVAWDGTPLLKPGVIDMAIPKPAPDPALPAPALYFRASGAEWRRIGGSSAAGRIWAPMDGEGCYALYRVSPTPSGGATLSALLLTPRVFSPSGRFATDEIVISFQLGQAAPVTVGVYNPAGRLVRQLLSGEPRGAGANVVRWDGRRWDGGTAAPGIYVVSVQALGKRRTATLAVAR